MSLTQEIMNIPCRRADGEFSSTAERLLYKEGHRDSRHDAVEIALAYEPPVLEKAHVHDLYLCLRKHNQTIPSDMLVELKEFLLKFAV